MMTSEAESLRLRIRALVSEYHTAAFHSQHLFLVKPLCPLPAVSSIREMQVLMDSTLDFWLTTGRFADQFESDFAKFMGVRDATLVNSGSSANLLALTALTSPKLGDQRLQPGDEVITVAAGFPTTVNPILQNGLVPSSSMSQIPTYNIDARHARRGAVGAHPGRHGCPHLGNPFDLAAVTTSPESTTLAH